MANLKLSFVNLCDAVESGDEVRLVDAGHNGEFYALTFELPNRLFMGETIKYDVDVVDIYETFCV